MKSSNPSLRRLAFAAAVLAAGNFAFAQSSTATSDQGASNSTNGSMHNGNDQSGSNSNWSSSSSSNPSNSNYDSTSGSHDQSSMSSNSDMNSSSNKDKLSWGDRRFVRKAAEDGMTEVAIAQLAVQKATNPDVRQFAQQMVSDHTQANEQLMSLASQKNVKLDQDDATKDRTYRRLSKASGNDFDREFIDHMVDEHEKDVRMFQKESDRAKDTDVKQFASSTLPKLQQHLQHVQQLQQSIIPTGGESMNYSGSSSTGTSTSSSSMNGANGSSSWNSNRSSSNGAGSMSGSKSTGTMSTAGSSSGATGSSTSTTR